MNYGNHLPYNSGNYIYGWGSPWDYSHGDPELVRKEIERIVAFYRDGSAARLLAERKVYRDATLAKLRERGIVW